MAQDTSLTRLYLTLPDRLPDGIENQLRVTLEAVDAASVLLRHNIRGSDTTTVTDAIIALCHSHAIPVLLESRGAVQHDLEYVHMAGLDGLHISGMSGLLNHTQSSLPRSDFHRAPNKSIPVPDFAPYVTQARNNLGKNLILGVDCGTSRHVAMVAGEAGADYIGFQGPGLIDMVAWWTQLFEVPCVAFGVENPGTAQEIARLGCEFVGVSETVWQTRDPRAAIEDLFDAIRDIHNV